MITKTTKNKTVTYKVCRTARVTRDARYDGLIFSGSSNTKIYCRPICPGKPPLKPNNIYFQNGAQAEAAGFRPCLRCRPEVAPGSLIRTADAWEVRHALEQIHQGIPPDGALVTQTATIKGPAGNMPIGFQADYGAKLSNYWETFQLGFAKILLTDTTLSVEDVTIAARFESTQAMLNALTNLYHRDPLTYRKPLPVHRQPGLKSCALMLSYRPPLDWPVLLDYFRARAIVGVEKVTDDIYQRSICLNAHPGWLSVQNVSNLNALRLEVHASSLSCLMQVVWRVRRMFDLDADPLILESLFRTDSVLGPTWAQHPGVRVPVSWDAFEFAVRAIVGQLVSVGVATKLMGRISNTFSQDLALSAPKEIDKVFPSPACLQGVDLRPCGLTRNKAAAIAALAQAVVSGTFHLETTTDLDNFIKRCTAFRGIGDWTAQTIAMRGLGDPDAFPAGDLGIVKALSAGGKRLKPAYIRQMAERWRPWRAYAAMLLWMMKGK
jgi:AraC family transcriptional regulator, regulatory protein of adaptative response / DNA-3-methyladenine glycosylase II